MKKFVSIEIGCRGLVDGIGMINVDGNVGEWMEEFMEFMKEKYINEEGEDWKEYFEEFCGVVEGKEDEVYGVFLGEEESVLFVSVENEDYKKLEKRWKELGWRGDVGYLSDRMMDELVDLLMIEYGV